MEKKIRDILAHEVFHAIEFGIPHATGNCADYDWLSEATANWMIDHVYPADSGPGSIYRAEHPYAAGYMYVEHLQPIDEAGTLVTPTTPTAIRTTCSSSTSHAAAPGDHQGHLGCDPAQDSIGALAGCRPTWRKPGISSH